MDTLTGDRDGGRTVAALFGDTAQAQAAIEQLQAAGFGADAIGIATRGRDVQGELHSDTDTSAAVIVEQEAVSGGILGGLIGLLVGIGALAIPGVGPVIAGGILSSVLGATAVGAGLGAVGGGIIGALVHLGLPEHEAQYFASGFHAGGTLVTVHAGARESDARTVLESAGGDTGASATA